MTEQLQRFIESFKSEDDLRKKVATLLGKMGRNQGIEITHGAQEYGKDIVFYSPDGVGDWILNACVIKKDKITGSADDAKGARNVFNQVEQALDTPFTDNVGEQKRVARVYVVSPYDCSPITMHSIEGKVRNRSGQVAFLCGQRLLDKFVEFWPEFVISDSSLLGAYVAEVQKAFEQNDPLSFLLSQHSILSVGGKKFSTIYVKQGFQKELLKVRFSGYAPDLKKLTKSVNESGLNSILDSLAFAAKLLKHSQTWESGDLKEAAAMADKLDSLRSRLSSEWQRRYQQERRAAQKRLQVPVRDSLRRLYADVIKDTEHALVDLAHSTVTAFNNRVERANQFVGMLSDIMPLLHSEEHLNFCRVHEVVEAAPSAFVIDTDRRTVLTLPESLLRDVRGPLLVTAPAGYGKTSFCKWNVLADLNDLGTKASETIPIYIPLHQLANVEVTEFEKVFLPAPNVRELFHTACAKGRPIRMYLDGLDEVTVLDQQQKLMVLAEKGQSKYTNVQIVVTARDYVGGPSLRWLPRVGLAPFDDAQVAQLVSNWLGEDPHSIQDFKTQLSKAGILEPLMRVPLLGTLIIAVFKKMRSLPENKVRLYEIFVELMCGGWDIAKNIRREAKYGSNVKMTVLTRLAGRLHGKGSREAAELDVKASIDKTLFAFSDRWRSLLDEILEDGLLIRAGANLAFSHLSFQEFLAARDLRDPTGKRQREILEEFLAGEDRWREVLSFFVGMSDRPDEMAAWINSYSDRNAPPDHANRIDFLLRSIEMSSPGMGWRFDTEKHRS